MVLAIHIELSVSCGSPEPVKKATASAPVSSCRPEP